MCISANGSSRIILVWEGTYTSLDEGCRGKANEYFFPHEGIFWRKGCTSLKGLDGDEEVKQLRKKKIKSAIVHRFHFYSCRDR